MAKTDKVLHGRIKFWKTSAGFGFAETNQGDVYVHVRQLSQGLRQLADTGQLEGQEVVIQRVRPPEHKGQRPSAVGVESRYAYERRETKRQAEEQAKDYWPNVPTSMEPLGFVIDGEVISIDTAKDRGCPVNVYVDLTEKYRELVMEKHGLKEWEVSGVHGPSGLAKVLKKKKAKALFDQMQEALPLFYGAHSTAWEKAVQCVIPAVKAQVVVMGQMDPDGRSASWSYLEHQNVSRLSPTRDGGGVLVSVACFGKQGAVRIGGVEKWFEGFDHYSKTIYPVETADALLDSKYHVSLENAERLWRYSRWFELEDKEIYQAWDDAQEILEAQKIWQEEMPGVPVGDLQAALEFLGLDPRDVTFKWVNQVFWYVPPFFAQSEEDMVAECKRLRQETAE